MIINTGSRTDIPAYFSTWFFNRIKEGYVLVRNPYYPNQVTRYRLSPEVVDCLSFCTKNPEPMLDRLNEIRQFGQLWLVTLTPYGKEVEPNVPDKEMVINHFKKLSDMVGIQAVGWRYDPIFISENYPVSYHIESFEEMAQKLSGYVDNCTISFIDLYAKTKRNFPGIRRVAEKERHEIGKAFARIGKEYGIVIRSCCEGEELFRYGVDIAGCMSQAVLERAVGYSMNPPKRKNSARGAACSCLLGNDIGAYNTCGHGCLYCYANEDKETVVQNMRLHRPDSPFLIGGVREADEIREAKQVLYLDGQMSLF